MEKRRLFITGIPTAGKSYLGNKLAKEVGGICVSIDDFRDALAADARYAKWVNFYVDQDEQSYYATTSREMQWAHLVQQSEGIWPGVLEQIRSYATEERPVIFEGVNILPHLAARDLQMPGIVIVGTSFEDAFLRNKMDPRWGATAELQQLEADAFFNGERPHYQEEAGKYGYPVFVSADEAWETAIALVKK